FLFKNNFFCHFLITFTSSLHLASTYLISAWHSFLKIYLWFIGTKKCFPRCFPSRYRKFLKSITRQKREIVNFQTQIMIEKLKFCESTNNEDIKLSLITMLKQFCKRKNISY